MSLADFVYTNAPLFLQNRLISHYGAKLIKQRYGPHYWKMRSHFESKDYSLYQSEIVGQLENLNSIINHARENSAFYRDLYQGLDGTSLNSVDDLKRFPVVDKEMLRANIERVYTVSENEAVEAFTGGTTGKSLRVLFTSRDLQTRMAYLDAFKTRVGVDPFKSKKATFSGRGILRKSRAGGESVYWRHNSSYNQRLYSTFDMTSENMPLYLRDLNAFRPEVINGFVSAIYQLAKYVLDRKVSLSFVPAAIFTTSENLLPYQRDAIELAFGSHVFNQYASAEGAPFVTECSSGRLHYNIDTGVIEVVDLGRGAEILVTSFTTYGTPLIRYRIGDCITMSEEGCPCGSSHPVVESIDGRAVDYLYSKSKGKVSLSHLADVIKGLSNCVHSMQFHQTSLSEIRIDVVVDESVFDDQAERKILESMAYRFGHETTFKVCRVESIPREASGKYALIKRDFDVPDLSE